MKNVIMKYLPLLLCFALLEVCPGNAQEKTEPTESRVFTRSELCRAHLNCAYQNISNQFTPGYKAAVMSSDLVPNSRLPRTEDFKKTIDLRPGEIFESVSPTSLAIDGPSFFLVERSNNREYTRNGDFRVKQGFLTNAFGQIPLGYAVDNDGIVSKELSKIKISPERHQFPGEEEHVSYRFDTTGQLIEVYQLVDNTTKEKFAVYSSVIYQIALANFEAPSKLEPSEQSILRESSGSGHPRIGFPGQEGLGLVRPSSVELSNVDFQKEEHLVSEAKKLYNSLQESKVTLCGTLPISVRNLLLIEQIGITEKGHLVILEGQTREHLLQGLSVAYRDAPNKDSELLKRLMLSVDPNLVFAKSRR